MYKTENKGIIGSSETINSKSFIERTDKYREKSLKVKTRNEVECGNMMLSEWAEYKSSLLIVFLNDDKDINFDLKIFLHKMIVNILTLIKTDLHLELMQYMRELATDPQGSATRAYPVSQSQVWLKDNNVSGLWDDFYGLINFSKWLWFRLNSGAYYNTILCDESSLNYHILITIFQQMILRVQLPIKGTRKDYNVPAEGKTQYIGISVMEKEFIKRKIKINNANAIIEPWVHPGLNQCNVPYFGGYGKLIKEYRESNSNEAYSSLKCGISGSVNYFLFLHLLSNIIGEDKSVNYSSKRLILTLIMQLGGDGGHNIREIIFGLTSSVIVLFHMIKDVKNELLYRYGGNFKECINSFIKENSVSWIQSNTVLGHIYREFSVKGIGNKLDSCQNNGNKKYLEIKLFISLLNALANWEPSIITLYDLTSDINIVGIYKKDINFDIPNFNELKEESYNILFGNKQTLEKNGIFEDINQINSVQLFFALDRDRYLLDKDKSFKTAADDKISFILKSIYSYKLLDRINSKLNRDFKECYPTIEMPYIPFA
jgi:hypothetical protein